MKLDKKKVIRKKKYRRRKINRNLELVIKIGLFFY